MNVLQAVILAIVEGVTEFLPVSSTGHLILASKLMTIPLSEFLKTFEIAIQLGAIMSVVWLYRRELVSRPKLWGKIGAAFIPTGIAGFLFYKTVKNVFLGSIGITTMALLVGGLVMIGIEMKKRKLENRMTKIEDVSWGKAVGIGLIQAAAVVPGVSRAAATIIGGMTLGLDRKTATEFSFLLAVPTMLAATGYDLVKSGTGIAGGQWLILGIGFVGAFVTAMATVKWLVRFVEKHSFVPFGIYRIALAWYFLGRF